MTLELRDGPYGRRHWCTEHTTWWKLCPCPGQYQVTLPPAPTSPPEPPDPAT